MLIFILNLLQLSYLIGHSRGPSPHGHLTMKKPSLLLSLQLPSTHHLHPWHTPDRACRAVPARTPGQCQLALSAKPTTDSPAPHQPFTSPHSWIPEVQPDSRHYLLTSHSKTRAKGKVGQSFWPGSPSHCSPRPRLRQYRTQQLALPQGFQPAKIPTRSMFPR